MCMLVLFVRNLCRRSIASAFGQSIGCDDTHDEGSFSRIPYVQSSHDNLREVRGVLCLMTVVRHSGIAFVRC